MAKILYNTDNVDDLTTQEMLWFYNGLDCCVTREIYDVLKVYVERDCQQTYNFEMAMLGPAMTMSRRGMLVSDEERTQTKDALDRRQAKIIKMWDHITEAIEGKPVNFASPKQMAKLMYETLAIPPQMSKKKGKLRVTTDRSAMEKIEKKYPRGKVLARILIELRDIKKKYDVVNTVLDKRGRFLTSFNVAGTETWRWSSSASSFRIGNNMQNVTKELRRMLVADPGYKLFYADLDQAESIAVAGLSGDEAYTKACFSGDLHTSVAKMIWPDFAWTGDKVKDRAIAEEPYRHGHSYRDFAKLAGHGVNYMLTPGSLQNKLNIKLRDAWKFYLQYLGGTVELSTLERWHTQDPTGGFDLLIDRGTVLDAGEGGTNLIEVAGAFPGIKKWHESTARTLEVAPHQLTTPYGMTRTFWSNPKDATTLREAIAFIPQSTIGVLLHIGMHRVWKELDGDEVQILANVHDAILGQIKEEVFDDRIEEVLSCMNNPITFSDGKQFTVPTSAECGYNWGPLDPNKKIYEDGNPNGMGDWVHA